MTDTLDDKLREVVERYESTEATIAQIKQAFADEGYRKIFGEPVELDPKDQIHDLNDIARMTGQEWFDRFMVEIELLTKHMPKIFADLRKAGLNKEAVYATLGAELDLAAKRASGIDT